MDPKNSSQTSPDPENETDETLDGLPRSELSNPEEDMTYRELEIHRLDNVQFVTRLMNFSPKGGLVQAFIIEAIRAYCEAIVKEPKPETDDHGFISNIVWYELAVDVKRQCDEKYGPDKP